MNKEALRKELEDLVKVTQTWHYASIKDRERIIHPSQWISSRLAALDDGDGWIVKEAVQAYWLQAMKELEKKDLGELERKNWEKVRDETNRVIKNYKQ